MGEYRLEMVMKSRMNDLGGFFYVPHSWLWCFVGGIGAYPQGGEGCGGEQFRDRFFESSIGPAT